MGLIRVFALLFVALLLLYLVLRVALSFRERERLGREWDQSNLGGTREDHVRAGMDLYVRSLRRRLLWGIIVVPMAGLAVLLYVLNVS